MRLIIMQLPTTLQEPKTCILGPLSRFFRTLWKNSRLGEYFTVRIPDFSQLLMTIDIALKDHHTATSHSSIRGV